MAKTVAERRAATSALAEWAASQGINTHELQRLFAGVDEHSIQDELYVQQGGYVFPGLRSEPWPDKSLYTWIAQLESSADEIREEFLVQYANGIAAHPESTAIAETGAWRALRLFYMGRRFAANLAQCPRTLDALSYVPAEAFQGTAYFSVLDPHTEGREHRGFINLRWRWHLPLVVPTDCLIEVGGDSRTWTPGEAVLFDDSCVHRVANRSDHYRAVLIFDMWHPDLTPIELKAMPMLLRLLSDLRRGRPELD